MVQGGRCRRTRVRGAPQAKLGGTEAAVLWHAGGEVAGNQTRCGGATKEGGIWGVL